MALSWAKRSRGRSSDCLAEGTPLIIVSASGGARMQEAPLASCKWQSSPRRSLQLDEARLPYISILTDPTPGA